jgi:cytosine/adenosine deaminase-related metal-dependent hydrolase
MGRPLTQEKRERQLLEWLETYTFPTERQFKDKDYAASTASFFLDELARNGIWNGMNGMIQSLIYLSNLSEGHKVRGVHNDRALPRFSRPCSHASKRP